MKVNELIASLQRSLEIYGDIQCVLLVDDGSIMHLDSKPTVKYEQGDELFDFNDEKLSLKDLSDPVLLINPR